MVIADMGMRFRRRRIVFVVVSAGVILVCVRASILLTAMTESSGELEPSSADSLRSLNAYLLPVLSFVGTLPAGLLWGFVVLVNLLVVAVALIVGAIVASYSAFPVGMAAAGVVVFMQAVHLQSWGLGRGRRHDLVRFGNRVEPPECRPVHLLNWFRRRDQSATDRCRGRRVRASRRSGGLHRHLLDVDDAVNVNTTVNVGFGTGIAKRCHPRQRGRTGEMHTAYRVSGVRQHQHGGSAGNGAASVCRRQGAGEVRSCDVLSHNTLGEVGRTEIPLLLQVD